MELTELNKYNLKNNINKTFACETSEDGRISIVTDVNVIVLHYKPNMENETNNFTFDKYFITLSDYHIANETGIAINEIVNTLTREKFYRLIRNDIFTPELENANPQITKPITALWSPAGVFRRFDSVLATVSNTGNVEIFFGLSLNYKCIANLTEIWVNELKNKWKEVSINNLSLSKKSDIHEQRVIEGFASCVSWSLIYEFSSGTFCYIAVGYTNGVISIWRLKCTYDFDQNSELEPPLLIGYFDSGIQQLTAINWCSNSQNTAWIVFGNLQGTIGSVFISFNESQQFEIKNKSIIWPENDIKVTKIISFTEENQSCFLIIKNSFMLIIAVDNNDFSIKCKKPVNFGNLFISGIQPIESNTFVVCSFTGIIKKIKIDISDNLTYEIENVKTDVNWDTYASHGIFRLKDGYIWGILKYPCKIFDHLAQRNPIEFSFCIINNLDPGKVLKENKTKHLHQYWELMDIIRCLASKTEILPCLWLAGIDKYDEISFYELRIIYWLTKASHRFLLLHTKAKKLNCKFPEPEIMEEIFFYRYHFERLKYTLHLYESEEMLPVYLLYSIYMLHHSIMVLAEKEYIKEYFSDNFHNEVKHIIEKVNNLDNVLTPICVSCELKFKNGQCPNMHLDDKCIITNVQTKGISKWNCPMCQKMAHEDLDEENPFCPLCDIPLLHYDPSSDQYRTDL